MPNSEPAPEPTAPPASPDPVVAPTVASPASDTPAESGANPTWRPWAIAGVVVAVLAGAAVLLLGRSGDEGGADAVATAGTQPTASAGGAAAGGFGPGARGTITEIDGATITVESSSPDGSTGTTTVETTDETTITESVEGAADDLAVGDDVVAFGEAGDDGTMVASTVSEGGGAGFGGPQGGGGLPEGFEPPADGELPEGFEPPADGELPEGFEPPAGGELPDGFQPPQAGGGGAGGQGVPASGEITAISEDSLTIESEDGTSVTVSLGDDTTFTITEDRSFDDLAEGDTVVVVGEAGSDDVVTATSIRIGDTIGVGPGGPGGAPGAPSPEDEEA